MPAYDYVASGTEQASPAPLKLPPWLSLVIVLLFAVPYAISHHQAKPKPGPLVREVPELVPIDHPTPWRVGEYTLTPLASCHLRARVLHTERYYWDRSADLSPIDIAAGWRGMSDSRYLDGLRISQSGRWYYFQYHEAPLPNDIIVSQSKNIHVIPANKAIARRVKSVLPNRIFRASGSLVKVTAPDGYHWTSSLSWTNSGEGSCLVFWVDQFEVED